MNKKTVITWIDPSPTTNVVNIQVWRKVNSGGTYSKISGNISLGVQTFDDVNIVDGTNYYYEVRAYNSINEYLAIESSFYVYVDTAPLNHVPVTPDNAVIESGLSYTSSPTYVYGPALIKRIWVNQDIPNAFSAIMYLEQTADTECWVGICTQSIFDSSDYFTTLYGMTKVVVNSTVVSQAHNSSFPIDIQPNTLRGTGNYIRLTRASEHDVIKVFHFDGVSETLCHVFPAEPTKTKLIFGTYYNGTINKPEIFIG